MGNVGVYHRGKRDETVIDGAQEVPIEVQDLCHRCQKVRWEKREPGQPSPRVRQQRVYLLSEVLVCDGCGESFHGVSGRVQGRDYPRMQHSWHRCEMRPQSVSAPRVEQEFANGVLAHIILDDGWRDAVLKAMTAEGPEPDHTLEIKRIESALSNLRKQHLWGALTDEEFKSEFHSLQRQRKALEPRPSSPHIPNLERAAQLLRDLPSLWQHPGITREQRRDLAREVIQEIRLREGNLVAVAPSPEYAPLFAYSLLRQYRVAGGERSPWARRRATPIYQSNF